MDSQSFGAYALKQRIQQYGRVEVYVAFDPALERPVTITLARQLAGAAGLRRRQQQIAGRVAALRHPHIARLYASGVESDTLFWVAEQVSTETLADRLALRRARGEFAAPAVVARQLEPIAQALDYAHAQDVIHGNLAPTSIWLTDLDEPVLSDFGATELLGAGWASARMAPEIAAGKPASISSDIYALGVILLELLVGQDWPPDASDLEQARGANLPRAVEQVLLRALASDPSERYATAGELAAAFARALDAAAAADIRPATISGVPQAIGRYRDLHELGKRGNLIVYRAYDPTLERAVAIKILDPDLAADTQLQNRFQHEIELIAALEHHAIVQVYDFGLHQGQPFVVMPFLEGGTLMARLRAAPMTPQQFAPILERVAEALGAVHARGIVHRQVKPSNILFAQQGKAYLSDIAISAISEASLPLSDRDNMDEMALYMSPEQARARTQGASVAIEASSDIYALGAILFEVVSGRPPYRAATSQQIAVQHMAAPIPRLISSDARVLRAYQPIIDRAMAKDPADRYPTADLLARDVGQAVAGRWYFRKLSDMAAVEPAHKAEAIGAGDEAIAAVPQQTGAPARHIDRYHVERELGRGGMAVVYLGYDSHIKRRVAIKMLPSQLTQSPLFQERFRQEAELVARFQHPSIVSIYDIGEHEGQPYIVMQYLANGTLADRLQRKRMSLQEIAPIIQRVAAALDEAHSQSVIHHDVKPGNIIFNSQDQALLSDFGIAVLAEAMAALSQNTQVGFTPKYVSPERVLALQNQAASAVDSRSDVYALGVIMFEALAGQPPFQAATAGATALAHVHNPIPHISAFNPSLPDWCQEIVDRALAKHPADRYQTAGELAQDLSQLASGRWYLRKLLD